MSLSAATIKMMKHNLEKNLWRGYKILRCVFDFNKFKYNCDKVSLYRVNVFSESPHMRIGLLVVNRMSVAKIAHKSKGT
jgi:hypothetical protein